MKKNQRQDTFFTKQITFSLKFIRQKQEKSFRHRINLSVKLRRLLPGSSAPTDVSFSTQKKYIEEKGGCKSYEKICNFGADCRIGNPGCR